MHMSMHIMHIIHMCAIVKIIVQHLTTYQSHLCVILVAMTKSCHSRISVCMCVHMHTYVYELVSPTTHESTFIMHHLVHMYTYHICVFFGHDVTPTLHTICHLMRWFLSTTQAQRSLALSLAAVQPDALLQPDTPGHAFLCLQHQLQAEAQQD